MISVNVQVLTRVHEICQPQVQRLPSRNHKENNAKNKVRRGTRKTHKMKHSTVISITTIIEGFEDAVMASLCFSSGKERDIIVEQDLEVE